MYLLLDMIKWEVIMGQNIYIHIYIYILYIYVYVYVYVYIYRYSIFYSMGYRMKDRIG